MLNEFGEFSRESIATVNLQSGLLVVGRLEGLQMSDGAGDGIV